MGHQHRIVSPQMKNVILAIEDYLEKTHDGTSLGKVRNSLNEFAQKYNQLDHEEASIYGTDGKKLKHINQKHSTQVDLNEITDYLNKEGITGCHIDHNHPINHYEDSVPSPLSIPDMDMLRIKNDKGEYIYQSISAESKNGYRMTLIRNNNFSPEDEPKFQITTGHLNESCRAYYDAFKQTSKRWANQHAKEYADKGYSLDQFEKECTKQTLKELGSFEDFIFNERNYNHSFEQCNCKLRITKTNA